VSMTFHEMNINPFHVPESSASNMPDNVAEADEDDDKFGHLEKNRMLSMKGKGNLGMIVEENQDDSAEALSEQADDNAFKPKLPPASRKSTISGLSATT